MFHLLKIKYSHKLKPQTLSPMALWWDGCKAKRLTSLKIYLAEVQSIFLLPHTFSTDKKAKRVLIRFEQSLASPHIVLHGMLFTGWPHHLFRWRTGLWRCCREVCVRELLRKEIVGLSPWICKQTQRAGTLHQVITNTKLTFDPSLGSDDIWSQLPAVTGVTELCEQQFVDCGYTDRAADLGTK